MSSNLSLVPRSFLDLTSQQGQIAPDETVNVTTTLGNGTDTCGPLKQTYVQVVAALPAIVAVENAIFLYAVIHYRSRLKHNNVYRYVASALVANIVLSALGFYHFMNYYYQIESTDSNLWWAFRKGMTLALSLTLLGNIGLLIYGIEDSTYVVGRSIRSHHQSISMDPQFRRRKANLLICFVWALPTIYGLLAMTDWNCHKMCTCTLSYKSGRSICEDEGQLCSRIYTPMSRSYLLVVFILWLLECVGLLILLCKSISNVRRGYNNRLSGAERVISFTKTLSIYSSSHSVVFVLFGLFVACTAPIMMLFILDYTMESVDFHHMLVNIVTPLPMIYCFISPFLVTHRLSGLKSAILMTISVSKSKSSPLTKSKQDSAKIVNVSMANGSTSSSSTPV